jgi:hypothetical protein
MTRTRKWLHSALAAVVMLCLAGIWQRGQAQEKPAEKAPEKALAGRTLKVKLNYSGPGTVDEKHKIFVFVFDTPDFVRREDAMPIAYDSGTAKDATLTFSDVATSPVYLIAIYDPTGGYEGMSKPPTGCSLGIYGTTPGEPGPIVIEAGKTTQVDVAFDDTIKMP